MRAQTDITVLLWQNIVDNEVTSENSRENPPKVLGQ